MSSQVFVLRPAEPTDEAFLRALFFQIRTPEFERTGLGGSQLQLLLDQQYTAMRTHYDRVYPEARYSIFELDGVPIGYQAIAALDTLHLIDIAILEEYRGRGIGSTRLKELMGWARKDEKPVTLTVEVFNPARRLYERLGFVVTETAGVYQRMRWTPGT
jgi:GNAT superfamily N-acetyltransferase